MDFTCPLCNHPSAQLGLCQRCHNRIHSQLDDLLEFWKAAHDELLPGRTGSGGRSSERTIGLNVAALSFIAGNDILDLLHEWESLIRQDRGLTPPALVAKPSSLGDEIADAIGFAQRHLAWSGSQDWFGDFASELRALHSQGMAAARRFVEKPRKIACPAEFDDGRHCGNFLAINHEDPLELFECKKCKSEWTTLRLVAVALSDPHRQVWLDAEAIGRWMGISDRHVRRVARTHNIDKRGNLFDLNAFRKVYQTHA